MPQTCLRFYTLSLGPFAGQRQQEFAHMFQLGHYHIGTHPSGCHLEEFHVHNIEEEDGGPMLFGHGNDRVLGSTTCFATPCGT